MASSGVRVSIASRGALAACLAAPARAEGVLEEVIVTAQKREQSIQDVGIAITAILGRAAARARRRGQRRHRGDDAGRAHQRQQRRPEDAVHDPRRHAERLQRPHRGAGRRVRRRRLRGVRTGLSSSACSTSTASKCSKARRARSSGATRPAAWSTTSRRGRRVSSKPMSTRPTARTTRSASSRR